jgi:transcriptional regulator of arginine metabolism
MALDTDLKLLLADERISDQSELLAALAARGHVLTQSTLSRKLKILGYQKQAGRYTQPGVPGFKLVSVTLVTPNLLVLRTAPGFAGALAVRLDANPLPGQAGTIAGDDTVFVAVQMELLPAAERVARGWV